MAGTSTLLEQAVRAAQYDNLDALRELFTSKRISTALTDGDGCSLLHWASINNRISIMVYLISQGCNLNHCGGNLMETPLHWAIRKRHFAAVNLLTENGAALSIRSGQGVDALLLACQLESVNMAFLLLCRGANPNATDNDGNTPLHWLMKNNRSAIDLQRLLLRFGTDVFQQDSDGNTVLHLCSLAGDVVLLNLVYGSGNSNETSQNIRNKTGLTPYEVAMKKRSAQIVRFYYDLWFSRFLPDWSPAVASALSVSSLFVLLQLPGWYGLLAWALVGFLLEKFFLPMMLRFEDRTRTGGVWGVILGACIMYYTHIRWLLNEQSVMLFAIGVVISSASLALCTLRRPVALRKSIDKNTVVTAMLEWESHLAGGVSPASDNKVDEVDGTAPAVFRLCATCLLDRGIAAYHCNKCNVCVSLGDHHCPYTSCCVGQGNRRLFFTFLLSASVTSAVFLAQSVWVETRVLCPNIQGMFHGAFAAQNCVISKAPGLALITWLALGAILWTASMLVQQSVYVCMDTTTYEVIRQARDQEVPVRTSLGVQSSLRGLHRFFLFLLTGKYTVHIPKSRLRRDRVLVGTESIDSVVTKEDDTELPQSNVFMHSLTDNAMGHGHRRGHGHGRRCCESTPPRLDPGALTPAVWAINAAERV